jgi:murein DD-endopeptidase MepM/ murein hydrolase activator NlpD
MLHFIHPALSRAATLDPYRFRHQALLVASLTVAASLMVSAGLNVSLAAAAESNESLAESQVFVAGLEPAAAASLSSVDDVRGVFTVDVRPPLLYPVGAGAPVGSSFGHRVAACDACSTQHFGVDWNPGYGTPVVSIADGTVTLIGDPSNSLGVHLEISHVINGQPITSVYAHLQAGSIPFAVGDRVRVGDQVGLVGTTGVTTAPHLHFELRIDGVAIDPVPWMAANGAQ